MLKRKKPKSKVPVIVNNKMKGDLGATTFKDKTFKKPLKIEVNVKKHKGDRAELASTIKHELTHVKHPKMTEKEVYKRTAKTKISPSEQAALVAKLRMKGINYKMGVAKRKLGIKGDTEPGALISKMKLAQKTAPTKAKTPSKVKLGIMGLV